MQESITEDNTRKVIDKGKVKRAQEELVTEQRDKFIEKCREGDWISCILFDGWIVPSRKNKIKEEHYSVVNEPGSNYLFHFTPETATTEESHAEQIAKVWFA